MRSRILQSWINSYERDQARCIRKAQQFQSGANEFKCALIQAELEETLDEILQNFRQDAKRVRIMCERDLEYWYCRTRLKLIQGGQSSSPQLLDTQLERMSAAVAASKLRFPNSAGKYPRWPSSSMP
jgi:hypothetical protein